MTLLFAIQHCPFMRDREIDFDDNSYSGNKEAGPDKRYGVIEISECDTQDTEENH